MKESVKTVAEKIKLDGHGGAKKGDELAGFYTEMFFHILKAKIIQFMNVCTLYMTSKYIYVLISSLNSNDLNLQSESAEIRLSELNIFDIAPVREEGNSKKDFIEGVFEGSLNVSSYEELETFETKFSLQVFF